jgi:two-component system chemotaxis response regulator CheB
VLVVDDSALVRRMLGQVLAEDRRFELVGFARDGAEGLLRARDLEPDVITLDQMMPGMTGLEALPELARQSTARVVMLSSVEDPEMAYAALELGAVEFVSKPRDLVEADFARFGETLRAALETAFLVPPERRAAASHAVRLARTGAGQHLPRAAGAKRAPGATRPHAPRAVVVLAASTGGPPALEAVFAGLSAADDSAYLVVQHLPDGFAASLARRLGRVTDITCVEASDGIALEPGVAYVAPHGTHLTVAAPRRPVVRLEDGPPRHGLIPAGDPLFTSVARTFGERSVGVVLTGMGIDGAAGLAALRDAGAHTIVQDEASSTVWGMPGAAVRAGAASCVLPLGEIAAEIRRALARVAVS